MNVTHQSLSELLSKIEATLGRIEDYEDGMPAIERDILLEQIRRLYDMALHFENAAGMAAITDVVEKDLPEPAEKTATQVFVEENTEPEVVETDNTAFSGVAGESHTSRTEASFDEIGKSSSAGQAAVVIGLVAETTQEGSSATIATPEAVIPDSAEEKDDNASLFAPAEPEPDPDEIQSALPQLPDSDDVDVFSDADGKDIIPDLFSVPEEEQAVENKIKEPTLFDEEAAESRTPKAEAESEKTVAPVSAELEETAGQSPKKETLWDKLHTTGGLSIAEKMEGGLTLSDRLAMQEEGKDAAGKDIPQTIIQDKPETQETPESQEPIEKSESQESQEISENQEPQEAPEPQETLAPAAQKPLPVDEVEKPASPRLVDLLRQGDKEEQPTVRTIGERLGENGEQPLEQKIGSHRVTDLRQIININDKFSFMSELFHNNMKAYNKFILDLNSIDDRATALAYVKSVEQENHWDVESLAVKTFYNILERKF